VERFERIAPEDSVADVVVQTMLRLEFVDLTRLLTARVRPLSLHDGVLHVQTRQTTTGPSGGLRRNPERRGLRAARG
jgi:hypothetical protein